MSEGNNFAATVLISDRSDKGRNNHFIMTKILQKDYYRSNFMHFFFNVNGKLLLGIIKRKLSALVRKYTV